MVAGRRSRQFDWFAVETEEFEPRCLSSSRAELGAKIPRKIDRELAGVRELFFLRRLMTQSVPTPYRPPFAKEAPDADLASRG